VVGGNAALASERIGGKIGDREHRRYMGKDQGLVEPRSVRLLRGAGGCTSTGVAA
jgi:hypothetical protein